jgi:hypothetical protein
MSGDHYNNNGYNRGGGNGGREGGHRNYYSNDNNRNVNQAGDGNLTITKSFDRGGGGNYNGGRGRGNYNNGRGRGGYDGGRGGGGRGNYNNKFTPRNGANSDAPKRLPGVK